MLYDGSNPIIGIVRVEYLKWGDGVFHVAPRQFAALYGVLGMICEQETRAQLPSRFLKAVSLMNADYKNSHINVATLCGEAGIAATTFRQLFRQHYQKTPIEYILDLRIEHARSLISGGMSVEAAAYESGFNDPKYFVRAVKKRFGCTPRTFKTYGK